VRKGTTRKKTSAASRLRPFWFLITVVAIAAAFAGYYAATWPGFFPKHVTIGGNRVVSAQQIAARAGISGNVNVWLQNMHAARRRIEAIPYVKEASIHRSLPANVRIAVTERTPYAVLRYGAQPALVDRDLRVLQRLDGPVALPQFVLKTGSVPADGAFVNDPAAERLRDDYETLAQAHVVVRSLRYDTFGGLIAEMHAGVRLLLGDDSDLQKKAALIGPILSQVAAGGRRIAAVDLRAPKTPVVTYH
jgi:cell division protein FtsQ